VLEYRSAEDLGRSKPNGSLRQASNVLTVSLRKVIDSGA
jgi:hypothetical protein